MAHSDLATVTSLHTARPTANVGDPTSSLTPAFTGQLLRDTTETSRDLYYATGPLSADWQKIDLGDHLLEPALRNLTGNILPGDGTVESQYGYAGQIGLLRQDGNSDATVQSGRPYTEDNSQGAGRFATFSKWSTVSRVAVSNYTLYIKLPPNFTGWLDPALQIYTRLFSDADTGATPTWTAKWEAMDPADGTSFGTPLFATRAQAPAVTELYQKSEFTAAQLSGKYAAGDVVKLDLQIQDTTGAGAVEWRIGGVHINWDGS